MIEPVAAPGIRGSYPHLATVVAPKVTVTPVWNPAPTILSGVPPFDDPVLTDIAVTIGDDAARSVDGAVGGMEALQPVSPWANTSIAIPERMGFRYDTRRD
jgi:hypothetical protein